MQIESYTTNTTGENRYNRIGATVSTATSTIMTVLLMSAIGQGFISSALLALAGLGFEIFKWSSWRDAWESHYSGQHDKRNILAALCSLAVLVSIGASIATSKSGLSVGSTEYLQAQQRIDTLQTQISQKQQAAQACIDASRITACAVPLQAEISELQDRIGAVTVPEIDEATALVLEVSSITGLSFEHSVSLVIGIISVMLDASGLYFLFAGLDAGGRKDGSVNADTWRHESETNNVNTDSSIPDSVVVNGDVNLSVSLGVDETLRKAWGLIESGQAKPSVRGLSESLNIPNHAAQAILYWFAESGKLHRMESGRGYRV